MTLRTTLSEAAVAFVKESSGPRTMGEIVDYLGGAFAAELREESERTMRDFVRGAAQQGLRNRTPDEHQPTLPNFNLPATITVPISEGEVVYVASLRATEEQWRAHRVMKESNITRAVDELRAYDDLTDRFAPLWLASPWLTVGECIERLGAPE